MATQMLQHTSRQDVIDMMATKASCPDDRERYRRLEWFATQLSVVPIHVVMPSVAPLVCADDAAATVMQPAELARWELARLEVTLLRSWRCLFSSCIKHLANLRRQSRRPTGLIPRLPLSSPPTDEEPYGQPPMYEDVIQALEVSKACLEEECAKKEVQRKASESMRSSEPALMKKGAPLGIASFNAKTMKLAGLSPEGMAMGDDVTIVPIINFCVRCGIDILSVQEHRWNLPPDGATVIRDGWTCYFSSAVHGVGGVAVFVSPRLDETGVDVKHVTPRIMATTFSVASGKALVLSTYAPTAMHPEEQAIHRSILAKHAKSHAGGPVFIVGDLNAADLADPQQEALSEVRTVAAVGLADLMRTLHMCSAGSLQRFSPLPRTYKDHNSSITLDHILVPCALSKYVVNVVVPTAPTFSDHQPVVCKIVLRRAPAPPKAERPPPAPDFSTISRCPELAAQLNDELALIEAGEWKEVADMVFEVVLRVVPKRSKREKIEVKESDATKLARELLDKVQLPEDFCSSSRGEIKAAYAKLRTAEQADLMTTVNGLCDVIDGVLVEDPERAFQMVNRIIKPTSRQAVVAARSEDERKSTIAAVCAKQLQRPPGDEPAVHFDEVPGLQFHEGEFTLEELREALKATTSGKAVGCDQLPAEVLKMPALEAHLLRVFNQCLATGSVPDDWHIVDFAMIPKSKGALTSAENWRYIALLCVVAKVYDRLLLARIAPTIDQVLRYNQNGFRRGRGTLQHILAWQAVLDAAKHQHMPLAAGFVDFTNAFPSVSYSAIQAALVAYGVPLTLRTAIMSMYDGAKGRVKTSDGPTDPFPITQGVMQGDTLAPFLFVSVLNLVLRDAIEPLALDGIIVREARGSERLVRHRMPELRLTDMDYADDIVLLSHTVEGLKKLMEAVETRAASVGLKVNFKPGKTEYMVFNIPDAPPLTCNGTPVVLTEEYKYLGSYCSVDRHINVRIAMAVKANMRLTTIWRSSLPIRTKLRLFRCLVEPVLLYGLQAMGLSDTQLRKLDGAYTNMLRRVHVPILSQTPPRLTITQIYHGLLIPPVSATIAHLHLSLLGSVARTGLETAKKGTLQPSFHLHLWTAPGVTGAKLPPARAPSLVNTAARLAGLDIAQLRKEVVTCDVTEWRSFCKQRAKTTAIGFEERMEDAGVLRSAKARVDEAVKAVVAARPDDEQLALEARAARTIANKLRFLNAHGVALATLLEGLEEAGLLYDPETAAPPVWKSTVVLKTVVKGGGRRYEAVCGDERVPVSLTTTGRDGDGAVRFLTSLLPHFCDYHLRLETDRATAALVERSIGPRRSRIAAVSDGVADANDVAVAAQAALDTALAKRSAEGLALRVVEVDTSQLLPRRTVQPKPVARMQVEERHGRLILQREQQAEATALQILGRKLALMATEHRAWSAICVRAGEQLDRAQGRAAARAARAAKKAAAPATTRKKLTEQQQQSAKQPKPLKARPYTAAQSVETLLKLDAAFNRAQRRARLMVQRLEDKLARARKQRQDLVYGLESRLWSARRRVADILRRKQEKAAPKGGPKGTAKQAEVGATKKRSAAADAPKTKKKKTSKTTKKKTQWPARDEDATPPGAVADDLVPSSTALIVRPAQELAVTTLVVAPQLPNLPKTVVSPCCVAHKVALAGPSPYAILSVAGTELCEKSTGRQLARAFQCLIRQVHPDTGSHSCLEHSAVAIELLQAARTAARGSDPSSRALTPSNEPARDEGHQERRIEDQWGRRFKKRRVETEGDRDVKTARPPASCVAPGVAVPTSLVTFVPTSLMIVFPEPCSAVQLPVSPPATTTVPCCVGHKVALARGCVFAILSVGGERMHQATPAHKLKAAFQEIMRLVHPDHGNCRQHASEAVLLLMETKAQLLLRTTATKRPRETSTQEPAAAAAAAMPDDNRALAPGQIIDAVLDDAQIRLALKKCRETAKEGIDGRPWMVARWSRNGTPQQEWLGYATGKGGRYAEVKWLWQRAEQQEPGRWFDGEGGWWAPILDKDGDEAAVTTMVPDIDGNVLVHALLPFSHKTPGETTET